MISFLRYFLLILLPCAIVAGCDSTRLYDKYHEITDAVWHKDSVIVFNVPVEDTLQTHNLYIQLRNETSYRFSNIWLFIEITRPGGEMLRDTFEVVLAEPSGRWLGKGYGGLKTQQVIYQRDVTFQSSGELKVEIGHGMREDNLQGIHDVGFRVERTGE